MSVLYPFPCETDSLRGVEADVYAAGFIALHPYWKERPDAGLSAVEIDVDAEGFHLSCTRLPWTAQTTNAREATELATAWCARILDVGPSELASLTAFLPRVLNVETSGSSSPRAQQSIDEAAEAAAPQPEVVEAVAAKPVKRGRVDEVRDKLHAACVKHGLLVDRKSAAQRLRLRLLHQGQKEED